MKKPLVGIIAASKIKKIENIIGMVSIESIIKQIAEILAELEFNILIVPEKNSGSLLLANFFKKARKNKKAKVFCLVPKADKEFGIKHLNPEIGDKIILSANWRSIAADLVAESSFLLCLSYSAGCLVELCQSKYWKKKVLVIRELVSKTLPKEAEQQLSLKYISLRELKPILELVKRYGVRKL